MNKQQKQAFEVLSKRIVDEADVARLDAFLQGKDIKESPRNPCMNDSDIIKICDLYSEGYNKFQELMQRDIWEKVPERTRMLECEMKKEYGGYEYMHHWITNYVLSILTAHCK